MKHGYTIYWLLRRLSQAAVFAGFCALPWLTARGLGASGSLFALDLWGLPFADPAAALQTAICGGVSGGAKLLLGAMLALVLAFALGRVFCSWICPYGLLSELVGRAARLLGRVGVEKRATCRPYWAKVALLLCCILCMALWGFPLLGLISLPGELSLLPLLHWQGATLWALLGAALVPILALAAELWTGKRLWCRFVCPQSVMLGAAAHLLPKQAPGLRIAWQPKSCSCKKESPCAAACPLALTPRHIKGPSRRDCTLCGDCLKACAKHGGALGLRFRVNPK